MPGPIRTEGFSVSGAVVPPHRPSLTRPFSDGSSTVQTDDLHSLSANRLAVSSPFAFERPSPDHHPFDRYRPSPQTAAADLAFSSPHSVGFHPSSLFQGLEFGKEHPEPPINLSTTAPDARIRPQSVSRPSTHGAKTLAGRRNARKLSMTDVTSSAASRGRSLQSTARPHPVQAQYRTMSFGADAYTGPMGLGIELDTHKEGQRTDSISPPDYDMNGLYGTAIMRQQSAAGALESSWQSSAPSLLSGSIDSYGAINEDVMVDSPITPAHPLPSLLIDDSYKKQRRRECHNQVEKRRREHINAKIDELSHLLPSSYSQLEDAMTYEDEEEGDHIDVEISPAKKKKGRRSGSIAKQQRDAAQCKGRILTQSVQYIHDLQQVTEIQAARILRLEQALNGMAPGTRLPPALLGSLLWPGSAPSHGIPSSSLSTMENHQLEVMHPSPEPEQFFGETNFLSLDQPTWAHDSETQVMRFESSALDGSLLEDSQYRRSDSGSGCGPIYREGGVLVARADEHQFFPSDMSSPRTDRLESQVCQQRGKSRQGSDAALNVGMGGMGFDAVFPSKKDEGNSGMRW